MVNDPRFLRAVHLEKTDCTPVWFMRQAGRYLEEYRRIRERHGLLDMFKNPEIAAEVTLQPLKAFPLDAAIIFADILLPLEAMGIELEFVEGEGPVIHNPVRTRGDVDALRVPDPEEHYEQPASWNLLMDKLAVMLASYLLAQARSGAEVLQLFDSWAGCLSPADYREYVLPHTRKIFDALRQAGAPSIHFGTGTADLLPWMREAGGDVIGVDWRTNLDDAWNRIGTDVGIQGNLDPVTLMAPWPIVRQRAREVLDRAGGQPGHVFNLGHGILPATPVDNVRALVEFVHEYTSGNPESRIQNPELGT